MTLARPFSTNNSKERKDIAKDFLYLFLNSKSEFRDDGSCNVKARHWKHPAMRGWGMVCVTPAGIWPGSYLKYVTVDLLTV